MNTNIKEIINEIDDPAEKAAVWAAELAERIEDLTQGEVTSWADEYVSLVDARGEYESNIVDALRLDCFPGAESMMYAEIDMGSRPDDQKNWPVIGMSEDRTEAWLALDVDPDQGERWPSAPLPAAATERLAELEQAFVEALRGQKSWNKWTKK